MSKLRGVSKRGAIGRLLLAVGLQFVALAAIAGTITFDNLAFVSEDQGMWGPGDAEILTIDRFLGVEWDESATVGDIIGSVGSINIPTPHVILPSGFECHKLFCVGGHFHNPGHAEVHNSTITVDTRLGGTVDVATDGKVGFQFGLTADSGSVDTTALFDATLFAPDPGTVLQGELFSLNPLSSLAGGMLSTNFPELTVNLDAIVGVRASASATACVPPFGCDTISTGELGFADQTIPIISFNDPGSPGQIKVLGQLDPALFQFDNEINIPGAIPGSSLGGVTVHVPDINATGGVTGNQLTASGDDDLLLLTADLDGLALAPLGLPGGGVSFNAGILSVSADLIDIDLGPLIRILQDFEFTPTLLVELAFDSAVQIAGFLTPQMSWSGEWSVLPDIALLSETSLVTPTFSIEGLFQNETSLGLDVFFRLDILKASFALQAFGLSFDLGQIGPLFQILEQANVFNTPPVFSNSFALGGFNTVQGQSFLLSAVSPIIGVPEPGSLILIVLGLGMLGMLGLTRRHRQSIG